MCSALLTLKCLGADGCLCLLMYDLNAENPLFNSVFLFWIKTNKFILKEESFFEDGFDIVEISLLS